ncbi:MAG TPA: YiiX/YebB-like N1pC/P60 family cysteine hydrolase [Chitinophagaceae bacterium]|nr:YiiX/YebB-like N1pC/P60 family cysteine hydrolase [Chitinophagaceae bacterium]
MKILNIILLVSIAIGSGIQKPQKKNNQKTLCTLPDPYSMVQEGEHLLTDGDLIVRFNRDPTSLYIKNFNRRDKKYSHAGLLFFEDGQPFVYHIVNGSDSSREFIIKDPFTNFCNPKENLSFGIFRYNVKPTEIKRLNILLKKWLDKKIRFDHQFNLDTDEKMYCSEMVSKAISMATHNRIATGSTKLSEAEAMFLSNHLQVPYKTLMKSGLIAIDDLYQSSFSTPVKEFNYRR